MSAALGRPRRHFRRTGSTNDRARALAAAGAPHGTVVTATEQTAGRGRQGRGWTAPAGEALLMSVVVRSFDGLLSLRAGLAVADVCGADARVKWPNDVLVDGQKVAGVLVEARPQEGWAVVGVGVNVAGAPDLESAGSLALPEVEPVLSALLEALERRIEEEGSEVVAALREVDWLRGRSVSFGGGSGVADGIDAQGRLLVRGPDGSVTAVEAGEVHIGL